MIVIMDFEVENWRARRGGAHPRITRSRRVHPSTVWPPKAALKTGRLGDAPSP